MSKESAQISEAIQRLAGTYNKQLLEIVDTIVTTDVDEDKLTFDTEFIKGVSVSAVPNDGIVLYPAIGSTVKIALATKIPAFLVQSSDLKKVRITIGDCEYFIDKDGIKLHGDNFGGLVKVTELTAKLNQLATQIAANFTAIAATYPYAIVPLTPFAPTDYQNLKVKHGNS